MIIANNNLVIQSDYIRDVVRNPLDYTKIAIDVNINCCTNNCGEEVKKSYDLPIAEGAGWYVDLDLATKLENNIARLNFMSLISFTKVNALTTPIDLGIVEDNCVSGDCTLQTYSGILAPLFKTQIDAWFLTIGIVSNVTVEFIGNVLKIGTLPLDFAPFSAEYGTTFPYEEVLFGYGAIDSKVFLSNDSLYIQPQFFNNQTTFQDGIYKFTFKFTKAQGVGHVIEENCSFVDVTMKCKVANHLKNLKKSSNGTEEQSTSTLVHYIHYALINSSNCGCNCDEMCKLFKELNDIVNNVDPSTLDDCGC